MSFPGPLQLQSNGLISCCDVFPTYFKNIPEMTAYLKHLKRLGITVVWINPVALAGETIMEKADPLTAQNQQVNRSLYAMQDSTLIDPRFSVVTRDEDGDMVLSLSQIAELNQANLGLTNLLEIPDVIKTLRDEINQIELEITSKANEIASNEVTLQRSGAKKKMDYDLLVADTEEVRTQKSTLEKKLTKLKEKYREVEQRQKRCIQFLDGQAMKEFTSTAKKLGMTPIFDLVVNHVANDAPLVEEHKEFFNFQDKTYHDATAFSYTKLLGPRTISQAETKKLIEQIPSIVETVWLPLIRQYVNEWGFCGVRVDCVRKVPSELRTMLYQEIRAGVAKQVEPAPVVILEESLFSELSPEDFVTKVKSAGATHNMGSAYYKQRLWHGGLPEDPSFEDHYKKSMVQNGVINFTGIHDHFSCAMTVCRELAFERLQDNKELYAAFQESMAQKEQMSEAAKDLIKSVFIHHYVTEIIEELQKPDNFNDEINRFGLQYRDKFLTSVFAGSGGYYMLSGDEFASLRTPSVFLRPNGQEVYPTKELAVFIKHKDICESVLTGLAEAQIKKKKFKDLYSRLSIENKQRFLSATKAQLKNEILANQEARVDFLKALRAAFKKANLNWSKELLKEVNIDSNYKNGWQAPASLSAFTPVEFFAHTNHILSKLPASNTHFWSELFKAVNGDVLVAVRVNGYGYDAPTDVVIFNLNPHKVIDFSLQDIEKISQWLQQRGFPTVDDQVLQNPDYHKAKGCIMGSQAYNQVPANLYFGGYFTVDKDLRDYQVNQPGSRSLGFNIVVSPQKSTKSPLSPKMPNEFVPEQIPPSLLAAFKRLQIPQGSSGGPLLPTAKAAPPSGSVEDQAVNDNSKDNGGIRFGGT